MSLPVCTVPVVVVHVLLPAQVYVSYRSSDVTFLKCIELGQFFRTYKRATSPEVMSLTGHHMVQIVGMWFCDVICIHTSLVDNSYNCIVVYQDICNFDSTGFFCYCVC